MGPNRVIGRVVLVVLLAGAANARAWSALDGTAGQPGGGAPTTAPASQPAEPGQFLRGKVIEVEGGVEYAPVGTDPLDLAAWKPVANGMEFGADTMIRTGLRSRCVLLFGEGENVTVIAVKRNTLATLSDLQRTPTEQRIRIGLGYGAVRGGSSEGTLRSDVVVDSTVATLAKRGTEGWEFEVEPVRGFYRISLAESGLVEALDKLRDARRQVRPHEYVDTRSVARMWVSQNIFNRAVKFYESEAVTSADLEFMAKQTTGLSSVAPAGSGTGTMAGNRGAAGGAGAGPTNVVIPPGSTVVVQPVGRPEGNFGFGNLRRARVLRGR